MSARLTGRVWKVEELEARGDRDPLVAIDIEGISLLSRKGPGFNPPASGQQISVTFSVKFPEKGSGKRPSFWVDLIE